MVKLSELVNVNASKKSIKVQGVDIPVSFNFESIKYIKEGYGKSFESFEKDLGKISKQKKITLTEKDIKIVMALVYSMVRSGGTECTYEELVASIPMSDLKDVLEVSIEVFNNSGLQKNNSR